jgi:hypothetical protein
MDATNSVGHGNDRALRTHLGAGVEVLDSALDQFRDLGGIELHDYS